MSGDIDIPDADDLLDDEFGAPRISLRLGGLEIEVEGSENDSLADVKETFDDVRADALAESEAMSAALRDRLGRGFR